jgi:hypothetical protein
MKILISAILLISVSAFAAAPVKTRKVSNSQYFTCNLEREAVDKNVFKKQYHFPFPSEKGETYELKGSMRWNNYKLVFHHNGQVDISISEGLGEKKVSVEKTHQLGKEPQFESFKLQLDLKKDDVVIPYYVQCGPE